eukprot:scaffold1009_cov144-Cylindrotheca_fusiformis.AAC.1
MAGKKCVMEQGLPGSDALSVVISDRSVTWRWSRTLLNVWICALVTRGSEATTSMRYSSLCRHGVGIVGVGIGARVMLPRMYCRKPRTEVSHVNGRCGIGGAGSCRIGCLLPEHSCAHSRLIRSNRPCGVAARR